MCFKLSGNRDDRYDGQVSTFFCPHDVLIFFLQYRIEAQTRPISKQQVSQNQKLNDTLIFCLQKLQCFEIHTVEKTLSSSYPISHQPCPDLYALIAFNLLEVYDWLRQRLCLTKLWCNLKQLFGFSSDYKFEVGLNAVLQTASGRQIRHLSFTFLNYCHCVYHNRDTDTPLVRLNSYVVKLNPFIVNSGSDKWRVGLLTLLHTWYHKSAPREI